MECKVENVRPMLNSGMPLGVAASPGLRDDAAAVLLPRPAAWRIKGEGGMALVLAILLLTLLASFGLWLMAESQNELKISQSNERREETVHLAEAACWMGVHALNVLGLSLPSSVTLKNVTPSSTTYPYLATNQTIQNMTSSTFRFSPDIFSSKYFYNTTPPAGWMLNWQGSTSYHTSFYLCRGQGVARLPAGKGSTLSTLFTFVGKPSR